MDNVKNEIKTALEQLLYSVGVTGMEATEKELSLTPGVTVMLPLTIEGARATIGRLRDYARENGVDFSEFESYAKDIENAVRNQINNNVQISANENGVAEYNPAEMNKEQEQEEGR